MIKCKKIIHTIYKELQRAKKKNPNFEIREIIGKYQYIYSSSRGSISLIELKDYLMDGKDLWEIYSLKGDLFEDIERFSTKQVAIKRIRKLLK